jgi:hypothetical protein
VWELGRATPKGLPYALTDTMAITHTLVPLTATTDLIGSQAVCSSEPARGMAGDAHGVGAAGAGEAAGAMVEAGATAVADGVMDTGITVDAALLTVQWAGTTAAADFMATLEGSTVAVAAASTVVGVADSTVVGVADTGNRTPGLGFDDRLRKT